MRVTEFRKAFDLTTKFLFLLIIHGCMILGLIARLVSAQEGEHVVTVTAEQYHHTPQNITLKKGEPVVFEFHSLDVLHGFNCPELGIRADIFPDKISTLRFVPRNVGTFPFHCDNYCGGGHDGMTGTITVEE
jgi:cytochrome c oxidase subunit II